MILRLAFGGTARLFSAVTSLRLERKTQSLFQETGSGHLGPGRPHGTLRPASLARSGKERGQR